MLVDESLRWHIDLFARHNAEPIVWVDSLVSTWNGPPGVEAVRQRLDPDTIRLASWAQVGDNAQTLLDEGFRLQRIHTGYHDWRRADLPALKDRIDGEGLGLFYPFPWAAFGHTPGSRVLAYHWSRVLLAGATAWRTDLAETALGPSLHHAAALPAYQPNHRHRTTATLYRLDNDSTSPDPTPIRPTDSPLRLKTNPHPSALVLDLAVQVERTAAQRLQPLYTNPLQGAPVLVLQVRYSDGEQQRIGLRYGIDTYAIDADLRVNSLWNARGIPIGEGQLLWRWVWDNPRPDAEIVEVSLMTALDGVIGFVGLSSP